MSEFLRKLIRIGQFKSETWSAASVIATVNGMVRLEMRAVMTMYCYRKYRDVDTPRYFVLSGKSDLLYVHLPHEILLPLCTA